MEASSESVAGEGVEEYSGTESSAGEEAHRP